MKKTTILIYKDITDPKRGLREATQEEWNAIMQGNKGLPMCQRRCFMEDSFEDCGVIDRMFIEVPYAKYLVWHKEKMGQERNRVRGKEYTHFSTGTYMVRKAALSKIPSQPSSTLRKALLVRWCLKG